MTGNPQHSLPCDPRSCRCEEGGREPNDDGVPQARCPSSEDRERCDRREDESHPCKSAQIVGQRRHRTEFVRATENASQTPCKRQTGRENDPGRHGCRRRENDDDCSGKQTSGDVRGDKTGVVNATPPESADGDGRNPDLLAQISEKRVAHAYRRHVRSPASLPDLHLPAGTAAEERRTPAPAVGPADATAARSPTQQDVGPRVKGPPTFTCCSPA